MIKNLKDPVQFWNELKQRRVVRAVTVYLAAGFAVLQAVDIIFPRIGLPAWSITLVICLLGMGLIFVTIITWIYEITPEGVRKTKYLNPVEISPIEEVKTEIPDSEQDSIPATAELLRERELFTEKIKKLKRKERIFNSSAAAIIIAISAIFIFSGINTVPFNKRDWIIITDFENLTGNQIFDKSLYTAFTISISQSRHINVIQRPRMIDMLSMMKLTDRTFVDEKIGREIAIREGINLYIVPAINEIGKRYAIAVKIIEAKSANLLKSEIIYADTQDEILSELDHLGKIIRRYLGESRFDISMQDKRLVKATTSSLEALKLYSLGIDRHYILDFEGAKNYYESALQLDTGFTSAKASLGNLYIRAFDPVKGRELLRLAVRFVDNLTERERLWVLALQAMHVDKNIPKGVEFFRKLVELYPDDPVARNNLGYTYQLTGEFDKAVKEYKEAIRIDPHAAIAYGGLLWVYLDYIGNADSALIWSKKMISDNPQNEWGYSNLGSSWICLDSLSKAEEAYIKARELNPKLMQNLYNLANTYRLRKKYDEAISTLMYILVIDKNEFNAYYDLGVNYQSLGNKEEARKHFLAYKKIIENGYLKKSPDEAGILISLASVLARLDLQDSSEQVLRKAIGIDSTLHHRFAEVLCLQGKIPEATNEFRQALEMGYRDLCLIKLNPDLQLLIDDRHFRYVLNKYFE